MSNLLLIPCSPPLSRWHSCPLFSPLTPCTAPFSRSPNSASEISMPQPFITPGAVGLGDCCHEAALFFGNRNSKMVYHHEQPPGNCTLAP